MNDLEHLIKKSIEKVKRMTTEEREDMYAEQSKSHNPFEKVSNQDLRIQLELVNEKFNDRLEFGDNLKALIEWKQDLERELRRRGLTVP